MNERGRLARSAVFANFCQFIDQNELCDLVELASAPLIERNEFPV